MSSYADLAYLADIISQLANGTAPRWLYLVIAFIPFSILIAVRESYCWFNKVNKVTSKLDRIDRRLKDISIAIDSLTKIIAANSIEKNNSKILNSEDPKDIKNMNDDKFYLEKDWTKK